MLRILTLIALLSGALQTAVAQGATRSLDGPRDTLVMDAGGGELIAYFAEDAGLFQLTILITEADGTILRTRMPLRQGQAHSMIVGDEESDDRQTVTFRREGARLLVDVSTGADSAVAFTQ